MDNTLPQFTADALLVVLVVVNGYIGWRTGTVRRVLSLLGLYTAFLAAYYGGNSFASIVHKGDIFANAWAFVAVLISVVLVFELLGRAFADRIERITVVAFDRSAAVFLGGVVGFCQALVIFMVALAVGAATPGPGNNIPSSRDSAANAVRSAALSGPAVRAEPALRAAVAPLIGTDLTTHLEDGTQSTPLH
jgi:Colicin V production protein